MRVLGGGVEVNPAAFTYVKAYIWELFKCCGCATNYGRLYYIGNAFGRDVACRECKSLHFGCGTKQGTSS